MVPRKESKFKEVPYQKITKIHSCVWKLYVKNSQNSQFLPKNGQFFVLNGQSFAKSEFSRHIKYDFLKEDHKNNFHTINQEDSAAFGSYRSRTLKTVNFGQKNALNGPNFAISEFSQHIEYDFLKEDHKNNFHTKNQEDSQLRLEVIGQKLSKRQFLPKKAKFLS